MNFWWEVPRFKICELQLGRVLGRGGFCVVNEIASVSLQNDTGSLHSSDGTEDTTVHSGFKFASAKANHSKKKKKKNGKEDTSCNFEPHYTDGIIVQDRQFIANKCLRNGDARYCVKRISDETYKNKERYIKGVIDLAIEMKILAVLKHPNIIKMRGAADGDPFRRDNFMILDRLYDIMKSRLFTWKKETKKPWNKLKSKAQKLLHNRLVVAYDLSKAFKFLHDRNIVYRDLKPDNVGFDVRDDVKMFDFGLAKELPPREDELDNTLYNLSGQTGSLRYMAPEVALGKPYNLKVDVFSFSILLWEIISLNTPFAGYNVRMHQKMVVEAGARPKIDYNWSKDLIFLMQNSWCEKIESRLNFEEILNILREEIYKNGDREIDELDCSNKTEKSL